MRRVCYEAGAVSSTEHGGPDSNRCRVRAGRDNDGSGIRRWIRPTSRVNWPPMSTTYTATSSGLGFGSALAMTISWSLWHSIFWAIVHGLCSWLYVIYYWWNHP